MTLFLDEVVDVDLPPTVRFRLRIYTPGIATPVVVIEERLDNSGPPAAHVVSRIAAHVRSTYLPSDSDEPVWVEAWLGRALTALVQDALPFCTYMSVLPDDDPPQRSALSGYDLSLLTGGHFEAPAAQA
jgi:hypothetical protein